VFSNTFQANRLKINLFWKNSGVRQPLIWFKSRKKISFKKKLYKKMFRRFSIRLLYSTWKPLIGFSMWRGKKIKNWKNTHTLSISHTHTHTNSSSLTFTCTDTNTRTLSLLYIHILTYFHTLLSPTLSQAHAHSNKGFSSILEKSLVEFPFIDVNWFIFRLSSNL